MLPGMNKSTPYAALVGASFVWCLLILAPPFVGLIERHDGFISSFLYRFFSPICHQFDSHSLHLFGMKLAVCARCFGIYAGFFAGTLMAPFLAEKLPARAVTLWIVAGLPMLIDVLLDLTGIHDSTLGSRLFTGSFFGIIAGLVLTPLLLEAISQFLNRSSILQGTTDESKT